MRRCLAVAQAPNSAVCPYDFGATCCSLLAHSARWRAPHSRRCLPPSSARSQTEIHCPPARHRLVSVSSLQPYPRSPGAVKFEGPWFTTQLTISVTIGVTSFLIFSYGRRRWPLLFAPRTKLKGTPPCCPPQLLNDVCQAFLLMKHTRTKRCLAGSCPQSAPQSSRSCRSSASTLQW